MQHHFAFTHLKPENFTKSSNNDDTCTNKYCPNHTWQFFVLGKLKIFLVRQFIYFLIEFVIEQKKQPIIGYLNEDGKSNIKSLTRRIQFYTSVQCCLGQYNGDPET